MQDIRELGLGWAWFVNDLRAFLPAWQDMELATPSTEEPVTQIAGDVLYFLYRLMLLSHFRHMMLSFGSDSFWHSGTCADWQDSHAMRAYVTHLSDNGFVPIWGSAHFKVWGRMLPNVNKWYAVLHGMFIPIRSLNPCHVKSIFRCHCIDAVFQVVVHTLVPLVIFRPHSSIASSPCPLLLLLLLRSCLLPLFLRGGGVPCSFLRPFRLRLFRCCCGVPHFRIFLRVVPLRTAHLGLRL